jgi:uncharacterized repeat protein (TIGR01451 family)
MVIQACIIKSEKAMKYITNAPVLLGLVICTLLYGNPEPVFAEDPAAQGPYAVEVTEYDFGDSAFKPSNFPIAVEVRANVHFPSELTAGPFPLVVFLHGRHATCYSDQKVFLQWPCTNNREPIPSYQGYDYIAEILASHGYIVVSISANGINTYDNQVADLGMLARAELLQHHLELWQAFNTTGAEPFEELFLGAVDLANIGTMGHSRGGEGVVRHYLLNAALGSPFGIRAVFPLAPVNFSRRVINNVPLSVLLPYCDGDVADLQGVHFYDDARYNVAGDIARKHTILVLGANHNFYNTIWTPSIFPQGSVDDWLAYQDPDDPHCGDGLDNGRLTDQEQRGTGLAYITTFFRTYLGGETDFLPILTATAPPPPSAMTDELFTSFHAPDDPLQRLDINRLLEGENLNNNTLGGEVFPVDLTPYDLCGGDYGTADCLPNEPDTRQPHTTDSYLAPEMVGLSQLKLGWDSELASYENLLPVGSRDISNYSLLQFRVSVNFTDFRNQVDVTQDFSVVLTDGNGNSSATPVSAHSAALFYPPGARMAVPKVVLNTVPIPLDAFPEVNLADIHSVRFDFDQQAEGALLLTDIAFAKIPSSADPVIESADLSLSMTAEPDPVRIDNELRYRIMLVNGGPSIASDVVVTDSLPTEVSFKEASDGCSYTDNAITCPPISLQVGQTEEYEFTVVVDERPSDGTLENTASVSAEQVDPDSENNSASVITRILGGGGRSL